MPVLFVGHGSPMNALEDNPWTQTLAELGKKLPRPKAIAAISAHWVTPGSRVSISQKPKTIHDFNGFPKELNEVEYPAPGAPDEAQRLVRDLGLQPDETWGLDHGTWSVLRHLYPKADIPVFQISLDQNKTLEEHEALGEKLQPLRERGVLILGSGNLTHNLRKFEWDEKAKPYDWAVEFDSKIKKAIEARDLKSLTNPQVWGESLYRQAHPTAEHYVPLLYVMGSSTEKDKLSFPFEEIQNAGFSMRMVLFS
ncbi:MAG TPA: 4,5-DOPA dioxygenase extradiol [bacterium]